MDQTGLFKRYRYYLKLEKRLADNTVEAYMRDLDRFAGFVDREFGVEAADAGTAQIEAFMAHIYDTGAGKTTQARVLSGVKSFFNYLLITDAIDELPTAIVDAPKTGRKLPDVLTVDEINRIIGTVDLSHPLGHRNRAMLETLYSCGLRVSELVSLRLGDLFFEDGYIRVTGKGSKQRLVPVSDEARRLIVLYLDQRRTMKVDPASADIVFLNQNGRKLTRVMIFTLIRQAVARAGIDKTISPHTFRHSFATHLLAGGASIRQVQAMLGHESITTTELYTHLDRSQLEVSVERFHPLGGRKR
ncbi:MAG: tyrosine recombinase XerD [Rikenellaceae bacterium]|nr:tyrosine recombinase XerD [Rikenellaceae bacterium]